MNEMESKFEKRHNLEGLTFVSAISVIIYLPYMTPPSLLFSSTHLIRIRNKPRNYHVISRNL